MRQDLGGVGQGGTDILGLQARILLQNLIFRDALGQHTYDELYRYARSSDHWLAGHYSGIDNKALSKLFVHLSLFSLWRGFVASV